MNTITIDTNVYKSAESYARSSNVTIQEFVEKAIVAAISHLQIDTKSDTGQQGAWHKYQVSPETMAMTFEKRKDIPGDYDTELQNGLAERYL